MVKLGDRNERGCPGMLWREVEMQMHSISIARLTAFVFMFGHGLRPPGPLQREAPLIDALGDWGGSCATSPPWHPWAG